MTRGFIFVHQVCKKQVSRCDIRKSSGARNCITIPWFMCWKCGKPVPTAEVFEEPTKSEAAILYTEGVEQLQRHWTRMIINV